MSDVQPAELICYGCPHCGCDPNDPDDFCRTCGDCDGRDPEDCDV